MNPTKLHTSGTENAFSDLERHYVKLRDREGRLYADDILKKLPDYTFGNALQKEWAIRKIRMRQLVNYLKRNPNPQQVMELGCGNGWLSHAMATVAHLQVTGVDINREELAQANRVFQKENLSFEYGDVFSDAFSERKFHKIIIAAAVQYFPDFRLLIDRLMELLFPHGEIHIIDSPFYKESECKAAAARTLAYYTKMGAEAMIPYYHHHSWDVLKGYNFHIVKTGGFRLIKEKLSGTANPFPWIVIEKNL